MIEWRTQLQKVKRFDLWR